MSDIEFQGMHFDVHNGIQICVDYKGMHFCFEKGEGDTQFTPKESGLFFLSLRKSIDLELLVFTTLNNWADSPEGKKEIDKAHFVCLLKAKKSIQRKVDLLLGLLKGGQEALSAVEEEIQEVMKRRGK